VSVVASVGTALYATPIERSSELVRSSLPPRLARAGNGEVAERMASRDVTTPFPTAAAPNRALASTIDARARRAMPWAGVAITAVAMLVLGLGLLTGLEVLAGKPAASLVGSDGGGGTTLGRIVQPDDRSEPSDARDPSPAPSTSGAETGTTDDQSPRATTEGPTSSAPTAEEPTTSPPTTAAPTTEVPTESVPATEPPTTQPPAPSRSQPAGE